MNWKKRLARIRVSESGDHCYMGSMANGWTHKKRVAFEDSFREFISHCYINSKDTGSNTCLGENLFNGQIRLMNCIFDGLEEGIHKFYVLKSRQLGISTLARAFSTFYLGMHDGLQGAIVFDTDTNKNTARREVETMIRNLPKGLGFPKIKFNSRTGITLMNDSTVQFMSAGVRASKSSGTLGRSVGLSYAHRSELCSYDNDEGLEAFEQSLSEVNPDRFYLDESTARGFNRWNEIWNEARADTNHCRCIFLGWWSKPSQTITKRDPDFEKYGLQPPTDREIRKMKEVKDQYAHTITPEQLAWIRRKMDPAAKQEGDAPTEYEGSVVRIQEQPWTEEDAFQMTGATFFAPEKLTEMVQNHVSKKFKTYMYSTGIEFTDCRVFPAHNSKSIELKVWEEPEDDGVYVLSADPAFGENEKNDRSAIQILRCYADGLDQVAEYAWPLINTRQFAWVIASLMGWYAGEKAEVYHILELNGPGGAVWNELQSLKHQIATGYQPKEISERGLGNIFRNVKNYIYSRPDAMAPSRSYHWKTNTQLKVAIMERLRDFVSNGMLHVRSLETLEEMKSISREGDSIKAQGSKKDDRVIALAMGIRCWEERVRKGMVSRRRTRDSEAAKRRMTIADQTALFRQNQLETFFAVKRASRVKENTLLRRASWRYGRHPQMPRVPR